MNKIKLDNSKTYLEELSSNYVFALENSIRLDKKDKEDITLFNEIKPQKNKQRV